MLRSSARPDCRAAIRAAMAATTAQAKGSSLERILGSTPAAAWTHCRELGFQPYPLLPLRDAPAR
jgi:hypothetical protein